jgi:hypothetical protein
MRLRHTHKPFSLSTRESPPSGLLIDCCCCCWRGKGRVNASDESLLPTGTPVELLSCSIVAFNSQNSCTANNISQKRQNFFLTSRAKNGYCKLLIAATTRLV